MSAHSQRLCINLLEPRLVPAGQPFGPGNILASQGVHGGIGYVREYESDGTFVRQVSIPPSSTAWARDIAVAPNGHLVVFNGYFDPVLSVFDPVAETWQHYTHPDWMIINVLYLGAVAVRGDHAFVPDDLGGSGPASRGLIRFDIRDGSGVHFADGHGYSELAVGFDGVLYALVHRLDGHAVDVYDPDSLALLRTISLQNVPADQLHGMTVNAAGELYVARGPHVYRLAPDGSVLGTVDMTVVAPPDGWRDANAWDLEVSLDGSRLLYAGGNSGYVATMDMDFSDALVFTGIPADEGPQMFGAFVNVPPPMPSISVPDPAPVAEGAAGVTPVTFTVTLSHPTTVPVAVQFDTRASTAAAGEDYATVGGTVQFEPGETAKSVTVNILGDRLVEPDETFDLVLSGAVGATITDGAATATILNDDQVPFAAAGPDRSAAEGMPVRFSAAGSVDPDGDPLTYLWEFGDGATGTGLAPLYRYLDDGEFTVTLTVRDPYGNEASDTARVTVRGLPPRGGLAGPGLAVPGWSRPYEFRGLDLGPADRPDLDYRIDWGDGQTESLIGGGAQTAAHAYAAAGTYVVRFRLVDEDGLSSPEYRHRVTVLPAVVEGASLYVAGTPAADSIAIVAVNPLGTRVAVWVNGRTVGTWAPASVTVFAREGNDTVTAVGPVRTRLVWNGGDGHDLLDASSTVGATVLSGDNGSDTVRGGAGRDLLIGGAGADDLAGASDDDLLVGAALSFAGDPFALRAVLAEWVRPIVPYEIRRDRLLGALPGGRNGPVNLTAVTVLEDGAGDVLTGGAGRDWFFDSVTTPDSLADCRVEETTTVL